MGGLPKKGFLDSLQIEGGGEGCAWQEKEGGAFEGVWYPNAHYEYAKKSPSKFHNYCKVF